MLLHTLIFMFLVMLFRAKSHFNDDTKIEVLKDRNIILYSDIQPANLSDSYRRIVEVPIVNYHFKYDSITSRNQIGVIGSDAQNFFPESIEILPNRQIANSSNSTIYTNFPVVDKSVIYMHGIAALKELIFRFESLKEKIESLYSIETRLKEDVKRFEDHINQELDKQSVFDKEQLQSKLVIEKNKLKLLQLEDSVKSQKDYADAVEKKELMELEEKYATQRRIQEAELIKKSIENELELEKQISFERENTRRRSMEKLQEMKQEQTLKIEAHKLELEKDRIRSEADARVAQEKIKEDLEVRKMKLQAQLDTDRLLAGIKSVSSQITSLVQDVLSRPKQVAIISAIILGLIASYYLIREISSIVRQFILSQIGKPLLVRETSSNFFSNVFSTFFIEWFLSLSFSDSSYGIKNLESAFRNVILDGDDKNRVINLALATQNTRKLSAPYRHVLLHGPPGTGKTLIARMLAKCSGMDYAIMSGGDVAPLGEDAVNQLHGLFNWANKSTRGLLVFIDEAEAFLSSRNSILGDGSTDAHIRNALNALLYQTGSPSKKFMLVLATNRPEDLDAAILDRIDVSLQINLPDVQERLGLIDLYMQMHVMGPSQASMKFSFSKIFGFQPTKSIDTACFSSQVKQKIAEMTNGFSGREISKLFISVHYALIFAKNGRLTAEDLLQTVKTKVIEHQVKQQGFSLNSDKENMTKNKNVKNVTNSKLNKLI